MSDIMRRRLPKDLRQAARVMLETNNTFPTGQAIMKDAADEIERLRKALKTIADGGADDLSANPADWASTIAFQALGGEINDGRRVNTKEEG